MSRHDTELESLFAAVCDGRATASDQRDLTDRLQRDPAVQDQYLEYVDLHMQLATRASLGELAGRDGSVHERNSSYLQPKEKDVVMSRTQTTNDAGWTWYATVLCVLVLAAGSFAMYSGFDSGREVADRGPDATPSENKGTDHFDYNESKSDEKGRRDENIDILFSESSESHDKLLNRENGVEGTSGSRDGEKRSEHKSDRERGKSLGDNQKSASGNVSKEIHARYGDQTKRLSEDLRRAMNTRTVDPNKPGSRTLATGTESRTVVNSLKQLEKSQIATGSEYGFRVTDSRVADYELAAKMKDVGRVIDGTVILGGAVSERIVDEIGGEGDEEDGDGVRRRANEGRDRYERIIENAFKGVADHPLSTLSIDVDTASYANTRQYLMQSRHLPPADAVRIEEMVNYFDYDYAGPKGDDPFAAHIEVASCPWQPKHRLVRVALKGKEMHRKERPESNLVFLVDVSGSMNSAQKLPLVKEGLKLLIKELGEKDRVAMVVYAGAAGLVLDSTVGYEKETITAAIDRLNAGGSTAGGAGIKLAYQTAIDHFIKDGVNRVILCSDGDFNVGVSNTAELEKMAEDHAKSGVFLSVMGFGRGNLNDAMMERITNKGNGNYAYIDTKNEAQKVFVDQMSGTLVTIAKDVKIQIEFNPAAVAGYRLIGYENRLLAKEDFNDDTKDAGEIGAGHTVTALYEVVPAGEKIPTPDVDDLKYQKPTKLTDAAKSGELLTLKLRYKQPDGEKSKLLEFPVKDDGKKADEASGDFKFASAVASFGMLLRGSRYAGDADYDSVLKLANSGKGDDEHGYRAELLEMVKRAKEVDKRQ